MSLVISAVMPELAVPLTTAVADTRAREERFAGNIAAASGAYQSTDQAGEQHIQAVVNNQLAPGGPATLGSAGGAGSGGNQFMSTAMRMAGQAAQAPQQLMGMASALPSGLMQGAKGAMQQAGQLSGRFDKVDEIAENTESPVDPQAEDPPRPAQGPETVDEGAGAGSCPVEQVPARGAPGRHQLDDQDVNL